MGTVFCSVYNSFIKKYIRYFTFQMVSEDKKTNSENITYLYKFSRKLH